jgi:hypothetical protein
MYQRLSYTTLEYFNKVNATIFDKYGAEITVNENAKEIILYHGTRASLNKILKEGLLIRAGLRGKDTKMQMIDEVLNREFGVTRDQIPEWVWRNEYDYERTIEPHLHMSINLGTAVGYSHQGCEIKAQVRRNMFTWLLMRKFGRDFYAEEFKQKYGVEIGIISRIACERNGKNSHVFQVKIPVDYLRKEDLEFWRKIVAKVKEVNVKYPDIEAFSTLKRTTMEIRCIKNIPPKMFTKIWRVYWKERNFPHDNFELKQVYP